MRNGWLAHAGARQGAGRVALRRDRGEAAPPSPSSAAERPQAGTSERQVIARLELRPQGAPSCAVSSPTWTGDGREHDVLALHELPRRDGAPDQGTLQLQLFADRTACHADGQAPQPTSSVCCSQRSLAYTQLNAIRRLGLKGTRRIGPLFQLRPGTIRLAKGCGEDRRLDGLRRNTRPAAASHLSSLPAPSRSSCSRVCGFSAETRITPDRPARARPDAGNAHRSTPARAR